MTVETYKSMVQISLAAFTSLLLLNSGALVALMTYIGNVSEPLTKQAIVLPFVFFTFGSAFAVSSFILSYFTQYNLLKGNRSAHNILFILAFLSTVVSLIMFVLGCTFGIFSLAL